MRIRPKRSPVREMRAFPLGHALMFGKHSTSFFYFCFQRSHFRSTCSALFCVYQLYPVQGNLYQLRSRRSKQQRADDNTSPGINNLQGNGLGPPGSCFKTLKKPGGEVPHVKNRKCGPVVSFSAHSLPNPSPPTSCPGVPFQPSHFLCCGQSCGGSNESYRSFS